MRGLEFGVWESGRVWNLGFGVWESKYVTDWGLGVRERHSIGAARLARGGELYGHNEAIELYMQSESIEFLSLGMNLMFVFGDQGRGDLHGARVVERVV